MARSASPESNRHGQYAAFVHSPAETAVGLTAFFGWIGSILCDFNKSWYWFQFIAGFPVGTSSIVMHPSTGHARAHILQPTHPAVFTVNTSIVPPLSSSFRFGAASPFIFFGSTYFCV